MIITRKIDKLIARIILGFFNSKASKYQAQIPPLKNFNNILIIELNELGDAILMTPFIRELKCNTPNAYITIITQPHIAPLFKNSKHVNKIIPWGFNCDIQGPFFRTRRAIVLREHCHSQLLSSNYDLAIIPRWEADYNFASFIAYHSGARTRIAFSEHCTPHKEVQNKGFDHLFTQAINRPVIKNEAVKPLEIIEAMNGTVSCYDLEVNTCEADISKANSIITQINANTNEQRRMIAIFTKANDTKRQWPTENYIQLCKWLIATMNCHILIIGGKDAYKDGAFLEQILHPYATNLADQLSYTETAAILKRCDMYIGNDSGPMHLAASQKTPIIEISCHPLSGSPVHANSPCRYHPWGTTHIILQPTKPIPPCTDFCDSLEPHCIKQITLDQAKKAFIALESCLQIQQASMPHQS